MLPVDRILFQIRSIPRVKRSRDFLGDTSRSLVDHTELLLFSSQEVQPMLRNPLIFTLPEAQKIPKPTENEDWRGNVMPSSKFSSEAAKSAAKVTYTIAPLPAKTKNPIPSLPAISPQIGTISRSYRTRLPAKLTTVSLVGRWVCLILFQVSCLHVSWCLYFNSYLFCHQFAICRRDRSKVAPSAFFEEKEQETFASKENLFILILHLAFKILAHNFNSYISYWYSHIKLSYMHFDLYWSSPLLANIVLSIFFFSAFARL